MSTGGTPLEQSIVPDMSEEENARWLSGRGLTVRRAHGRFWRVDQGRWQPTHFYARLAESEIRLPRATCWAYRAALTDEDIAVANGSIPMHVMVDLEGFSLEALRSSKRRQIRASMRNLEFVAMDGPDLLVEQGQRVVQSAVERHGYGRMLTAGRYRKAIAAYFKDNGGLVIGALHDGRLVGYVTVHAVGPTAYLEEVHLASDSLDTQAGPGLTYQAAAAAARSPHIRSLVHSLATPERPGLTRFKEQMGFPMVEVPARFWIAPGFEQTLRRFRPHGYYRWTGHRVGPPAPDAESS